MSMNKLINSIDLDLNSAELKSLISDVKLSLAFVVDSNHGNSDNQLGVGEVLAKPLDMGGTSEISDNVYKPINSNITKYPLAGEFIVVLNTVLGRFYLTTVNLFDGVSDNIDVDNLSGYVSFSDDSNINKKQIRSDSKNRKSVLENNKPPFDRDYTLPITYEHKFGDISLLGRYGNRISLTRSDRFDGEILIDNGISSIDLTNGVTTYIKKSITEIPSYIGTDVGDSQYNGQQIYIDSDRIYMTVGSKGIFQETSGIFSVVSDDNLSIRSGKNVTIDGDTIDLGISVSDRAALGDVFMDDFGELLQSMVRFAKNLKKQNKILSLSNAANNFLTDINALGWDKFDKNSYLSNKVYIE